MQYFKSLLFASMSMLFISCGGSSDSPSAEINPDNPIQETLLRVACVGDSITEGTGLADPNSDSYPSQLAGLLGEGWDVQNFGKKSATLIKSGSLPYWNTAQFVHSHDYNPDIVVIMLGTNDAKPGNWANNSQFIPDYSELINSYKNLSSEPTVYIAYPPPVYGTVAGITDARIKNEVIPKIAEVAAINGVSVIDIYSALSNKKELFPDKVHPNVEGARQIAQTVYQTIY